MIALLSALQQRRQKASQDPRSPDSHAGLTRLELLALDGQRLLLSAELCSAVVLESVWAQTRKIGCQPNPVDQVAGSL